MTQSIPLVLSPDDPARVLAVSNDWQLIDTQKAATDGPLPTSEALRSFTSIFALCNPVAGHSRASELLDQLLIPLFIRLGLELQIHRTSAEGDASAFGEQLRKTENAFVLILGGDGTTHEMLQGLLLHDGPKLPITLALLPLGTANAFYNSLFPSSTSIFASLAATIKTVSDRKTLPLVEVKLNHPQRQAERLIAHVVASTALHASILLDSAALRAQDPSVERFKKAAAMNWTCTYEGKVDLPSEAEVYDPAQKAFVSLAESSSPNHTQWVYLNACLTDRLEPTFIVSPLHALADNAQDASFELVAIPRCPEIPEAAFSEALAKVVAAMYDDGKHIDLCWKGHEVVPWDESSKDGELVVLYYRTRKITWKPAADDERARLICVDGALPSVDAGGSVDFSILPETAVQVCV